MQITGKPRFWFNSFVQRDLEKRKQRHYPKKKKRVVTGSRSQIEDTKKTVKKGGPTLLH